MQKEIDIYNKLKEKDKIKKALKFNSFNNYSNEDNINDDQ